MSKEKNPQQKKQDSYKHDRRNRYGENDKASRKAIRLNKALSRRHVRRAFKKIEAEAADIKARQKAGFKKHPDTPLGEVVQSKQEERILRTGSHRQRIKDYWESIEQP